MAPTRSGRSRGQPYHQPTQPRHLVYHKLLHKRNRVQAPQPQSSSCMRDYAGQRRHHQQILRHVSRAAKAAAAVASANTRIVAHYSGVSRDYVLYRQQLQKYANTQKKKTVQILSSTVEVLHRFEIFPARHLREVAPHRFGHVRPLSIPYSQQRHLASDRWAPQPTLHLRLQLARAPPGKLKKNEKMKK